MTLKAFRAGTDRAVAPERTLERVTPWLARCGITRVANLTGLDRIGIPVVSVVRPNARSLATSQGKGLTSAAAKASGVMEAIECYHAEHVALPLRSASWNELPHGRTRLDLQGLPRFVGGKFSVGQSTRWVQGRDLLAEASVWVPLEVVDLDFRMPRDWATGCFFAGSNGLSSGNTFFEAVSHGVCELIERDANTLWQFTAEVERGARRLSLPSVGDPACQELLARFEAAQVDVCCWDVTTDVGVASFLCTVADAAPSPLRPLRPVAGSGCHPRREIALLRALSEAAQGRLTLIAGARDDLSMDLYDPEDALARLERFKRGTTGRAPTRRFEETPTFCADTFEEDLAHELEQLERCGLSQVVVVDLTQPELGIPVVRTVVPGLEAMGEAPGYAMGARARRLRGIKS